MMWSVWNNSFLNCGCRWEWRMIIAVSFPIKAIGKNWIVSLSGIHIPSHPVVLDDYNLIQTIKITSKVALRTSEVLLNHKIFSKILIWFYTGWSRSWYLICIKMWCFLEDVSLPSMEKKGDAGATALNGGKRKGTTLPSWQTGQPWLLVKRK